MIELLKAELAAAEAREAEARANGKQWEWDRAYGAFLALQKLLDKAEKAAGK